MPRARVATLVSAYPRRWARRRIRIHAGKVGPPDNSSNELLRLIFMQDLHLSRRGRDRAGVRHLRMMRAIVRDGGVTRAAARLHLSQPALSHQLAELEADLGTLVLRVGRRLVPTPSGERLLRRPGRPCPSWQLGRARGAARLAEIPVRRLVRSEHGCYTAYHWRCRRALAVRAAVSGASPSGGGGGHPAPPARCSKAASTLAIHVSTRALNARIAVPHPVRRRAGRGDGARAPRLARRALVAQATWGRKRCSTAIPSRGKTATSSSACLVPARVEPAPVVPVELTEAISASWSAPGAGGRPRPLGGRAGSSLRPAARPPPDPPRACGRRWFAATIARRPPAHMAEFISLVRKLGRSPSLNGVRLSATLWPQSTHTLAQRRALDAVRGAAGGGAACGTLAILRVKAHVAALLGLATALAVAVADLRHARADGAGHRRSTASPTVSFPIGCDRPERHLPLPAHASSAVCFAILRESITHRHPRPAAPAAAGGLLLRRLLRGRVRASARRSR